MELSAVKNVEKQALNSQNLFNRNCADIAIRYVESIGDAPSSRDERVHSHLEKILHVHVEVVHALDDLCGYLKIS